MRFLQFSVLSLAVCVLSFSSDAQPYELHTFEHIQLSETFLAEGATFGDLSGDGVGDLVSGPYWYEGPDFEQVYTIYEPVPYSIESYSDNFFSYVRDFDADGWNDVLVVGFPGKAAYWYKNPGVPSGDEAHGHWEKFLVIEDVSNESPELEDLTGDGIPELVCSSNGEYGYAQPIEGQPEAPWTFTAITAGRDVHKFTHGLGIGDVNNDGRMDLLEKEGWHEQPAVLTPGETWTFHPFPFGDTKLGGSQMFAYDFDGDGDNDVMTSDYSHGWGLTLFENTGLPHEPTFKARRIMTDKPEDNAFGVAFSQLHAMALEDMNGDGIKDLITGKRFWAHMGKDPGGTMPPVLYWFQTNRLNDGDVEFIPHKIGDKTGVGTQLVVKDANNDGLPDIAVGNKKGTAVYLHHKSTVDKETWQQAQPARTNLPD